MTMTAAVDGNGLLKLGGKSLMLAQIIKVNVQALGLQ